VIQGELSCKERSATKPDSSWASGRGAPEPWRRKEQSDDRSHGEGAASMTTAKQQKHLGPPAGGPFVLAGS